MRILVGTYEICGWVSLFQKTLTRLGHQCDSLVKIKHPFYSSSKYTYNASRYHVPFKFKSERLRSIVQKINDRITNRYLLEFVRKNKAKYDLIIFIWDTILPSFADLEIFQRNNTKIIFLFAGTDVRSHSHFINSFDASQWEFPDYWVNEDIKRKERYIEVAEKYADVIYSVPDQAGLQTKPYYHLQIPIDLSQFTFRNNKRKIPRVLHLPSDPWKKGTDIIEATVRELISEGVEVEFFSYRNLKHNTVPALLQDMDILVDEIVFHGPGVLSFEAMASGCAVATRYIESSPASFRPPVCSIDAKNIKNKLRQLFTDFDLRQQLIEDGRKYVEMNNEAGQVAQHMLTNLQQRNAPDYYI